MNFKYTYARKDSELFCFEFLPESWDEMKKKYDRVTTSLADLCNEGDVVNGENIALVDLGMNYCYIVMTNKGKVFYSWQIKTIETSSHKYNINDYEIIEVEKDVSSSD